MAGKKEVETKDAKKAQALNDAIKQIEKQFGKGSVMKLGDRAAVDVAVIPTGSLTLDMALGIGGYPKELLKFMVQNQVVKQRLHYMQLLKCKNKVVQLRLLMPNMPLILFMLKIWELILMN